MKDSRFVKSNADLQKRLMQHLLYCYEITDLNQNFDKLEALMNKRGFINGHDPIRRMTRSFMMRNFEDTIAAANEYLTGEEYQNNESLLCHAKVFETLAKAYTEDLSLEDTIGLLVDDKENILIKVPNTDDEALVYQMIGYVYGERYRNYIESVRFLNRSYQIGYDNAVLESLAASYYFLGIQNGLKEDDTVDIRSYLQYNKAGCFDRWTEQKIYWNRRLWHEGYSQADKRPSGIRYLHGRFYHSIPGIF